MPRKRLIRTSEFSYHITIRSNNREWFSLPMDTVWSICLDALKHAHDKHPIRLQAFVLMSNHYHLLCTTPELNIDKFMFEFNRDISREIRQRTKRINRIFGDRYKWSLVKDNTYYQRVLKYIYQNPTKVGLSKICQEYAYSTFHYVTQNKEFPISLFDTYFGEFKDFIKWVNQEDSDLENYKTKLALSRPIFRLPSKRTISRNNI